MKELYQKNKDFKVYVDKECKLYGITKEQAFRKMMVMLVAKYYQEREKGKRY